MDIIQKGKKCCGASNDQATSHDDGVFSMTLSPILDNLSSSYVPDPSHLIVPDCLEVRPAIGMANFKSFKPPLSPKKQRTYDNNNNGLSESETKALIKSRWREAARKIKLLKDPWFEFHLESYPVEHVIRHRYNPVKKEWHKDECVVRMENKEFAHGAMRACYRLKKLSNFSHHKSWDHASNYVAKCYMDKEIARDRYFQDVRLQMDAKLWAELYNRQNPPKKIDIFQMSILEFVDRPESPLYHLEHYIEGKYIKYNSNAGFVEDINMRNTPHAFSHFTFEISNHELIVVDIQGVGDLYTDPQIHTSKGIDYGDGNLGVKGFALFFYSHICNDLCKSLGLTEFDLAPSEIQCHDKIVDTMKKKSFTKCRGRDEFVYNHNHINNNGSHPNGINMSARQRYLINRLTSVDDSNDLLFEIDENEHGSSGFTPQSPGMCYSPGNLLFMGTQNSFNSSSSLLNFNFLSANAKAYYANNSNNTSIIDSPFDNEDAARFYTSNAFNKPRASGVMAEKYALLNADSEYRRSIIAHCPFESILGKIHLELCKYHEMGRFLRDEHDTIDYNGAFFHLVQAANLGVIEALVNLAKIYMQLPHDILPEYHVEDNDTNYDNGFEFMQEAAEKGELSALYYVAKAYDTGLGLSKQKQIDWSKAIEYYRKIINESSEDSKGGLEDAGVHDISTDTEPVYTMIARIAEIYMLGINGVEKNPSEAADLFTEAADRAMQSGNGRCANKYYNLAEKASAEIVVNEN